ncbi:hypothetical protein Tco_0473888 [Tanacetum coccineum]
MSDVRLSTSYPKDCQPVAEFNRILVRISELSVHCKEFLDDNSGKKIFRIENMNEMGFFFEPNDRLPPQEKNRGKKPKLIGLQLVRRIGPKDHHNNETMLELENAQDQELWNHTIAPCMNPLFETATERNYRHMYYDESGSSCSYRRFFQREKGSLNVMFTIVVGISKYVGLGDRIPNYIREEERVRQALNT